MSDEALRLSDPEAVPLEDIPAVLGRLEAFKAQLWRRWTAPRARATATTDRLLKAKVAAERTGMSVDWLYDHAEELPFARRTAGRALRFSEAGIAKWLASRGR